MDEQAQRIRRRMVAFVEAKDIAASEGLTEAELDALCSIQFGMTLPEAVERFSAEGRAQILEAQVAAGLVADADKRREENSAIGVEDEE